MEGHAVKRKKITIKDLKKVKGGKSKPAYFGERESYNENDGNYKFHTTIKSDSPLPSP